MIIEAALVIAISDGDTIRIKTPSDQVHTVRLAAIDAPERSQPHGLASGQRLRLLVDGKSVSLDCPTTDRYSRLVCTVYYQGTDINHQLIRDGAAWVYRRYYPDGPYFTSEAEARTSRLGLWSDPSPVPPWEYRHSH